MADGKDEDALGGEHADENGDEWLDISVPGRLVRLLTIWGDRVGLTVEGYAKLLLFQAAHGLAASEPNLTTADFDEVDGQLEEISRKAWAFKLSEFRNHMDLAPPPVESSERGQTYDARSFDWEHRAPQHRFCQMDQNGSLKVGMSAADLD